jgi:hypothetical protein
MGGWEGKRKRIEDGGSRIEKQRIEGRGKQRIKNEERSTSNQKPVTMNPKL